MVILFLSFGRNKSSSSSGGDGGDGGANSEGVSKCFKWCMIILVVFAILLFIILRFILKGGGSKYSVLYSQKLYNTQCLDGSMQVIYESSGNQQNIMIYFDDQALCQGITEQEVLESCLNIMQSKTKVLKQEQQFVEGIFSGDLKQNRIFQGYSKIYVQGCDGTAFMGDGKFQDPSQDNNTIYMTGYTNMIKILDYIAYNHKLVVGGHILLIGSGSGGLTAMAWRDKISQILGVEDVRVITENSYFSKNNAGALTSQLNTLYSMVNMSALFPIQNCNSSCFSDYLTLWSKVNQTNHFLIQSYFTQAWSQRVYDNQYCDFLNNDCNEELLSELESYQNQTYFDLKSQLLPSNHNIWISECISTTPLIFQEAYFSLILENNQTVADTIQNWIIGQGPLNVWEATDYSSMTMKDVNMSSLVC